MRQRRKRAYLHRIKDEHGQWIQGDNLISEAAIRHYSKLFTQPQQDHNFNFLKRIENVVTEEYNNSLIQLPTGEEIEQAVKDLHLDSAAGPDGFSGHFYKKKCWNIIANDVTAMVENFFRGNKLTKFITHTFLIMIPKVEAPDSFNQLRPISLSNFTNKIISKEIIHDIKKKNKGGNVVIKIDMAKAYDKVSWSFLNAILRKMGFVEEYVDLIYRLVSNVWYSIIVNGIKYGFFHSTRGLKQGDPLSPALFIIAAESLSKALNQLHGKEDDLVIFSFGDKNSLKMIMKKLGQYEDASGQEINMEKSCPIYHGRKKISYLSDIAKAVVNKIKGWQGSMLASGGKATLIKHVLQSQTIHTMAVISPPKNVLSQLEKYFSKFFWGQADNKNKYHWSSWKKMCYPTEEGGVGLKSLEDICLTKHPVERKIQSGQSSAWRDLMRTKNPIEPHIIWKINEGKISFWWDNWTKLGALVNMLNDQNCPGKLLVQDFLVNNVWNREFIYSIVPAHIANIILNIPIGRNNMKDKPIWIPTNTEGETASTIWKKFAAPLGINYRAHNAMGMIQNWRNTTSRNSLHRTLKQITPIFILWELWKYRNAARYGNKKQSIFWIYKKIVFHIHVYINRKGHNLDYKWDWNKICKFAEAIKPSFTGVMVTWMRPEGEWIKINTDGSSNSTKNTVGMGGVVRNGNGEIIMAFANSLNFCTNNKAEVEAAEYAIQWCFSNNRNKFILELDSMLVINMLNGSSLPPWNFEQKIDKMRRQLQSKQCIIQHCYREANQVADALAKFGANLQLNRRARVYHNLQNLPTQAIGPSRLDSMGMPSFRIKQAKRNITVISNPP
ncbi:uncharacterized protein LOC132614307 [Lycium barbarum]|uniref:uncharacterized protein LOC132614307 n=1 Tax=Lycium barbarum TaxID=112863 RepID=UPI00293F65D4|nr:uncharacterized protein LOC132614307 [Lycium barbarum]